MQTDHSHASPRDSPLGARDYAHDAPRLPGSSTRASPGSQAYEIPCQTAKRGAFGDGLPGNGREMGVGRRGSA